MKKTALFLFVVILFTCSTQAQNLQPSLVKAATDPTHLVPVDKNLSAEWKKALWSNERIVYTGKELTTIGMPCGGIGAGQLYVRGDGTLANWWICNNAYNTGYGIDTLLNFNTPLGPWKVCYQTFTPLSYIGQGFSITYSAKGKKVTRPLDKTGFDAISFTGEYPIATIRYAGHNDPMPVAVTLDVFSPFIPLDARESATPGTILKFTVRNTDAQPREITLTGWLQNLVGLDLKGKIRAMSRNKVVKGAGMSSVVMDMRDPAYLDGSTFPSNHPYDGNISLSVLSSQATADADYDLADSRTGRAGAEKPLGQKLVGATATTLRLQPGESREVIFLLTWFFPNRPSYYADGDLTKIIRNRWNEALPVKRASILGNMYANWFTSSLDVATWLQHNYAQLSKATYAFHDAYYNNTTLPYWLNQRLLMPASTLATETCQWWSDGKFWAWEGVGSCVGTCTHVWNYEQALAHLFPELERNIRERTDLGVSYQKDGSILARNGWGGVLIDGDAGTILKVYREHLNTPNELFLSRNWPRIKQAARFLMDEDENEDGLIEKKQANTYDIAFYGANTYVGGLYLAAVKAAARMAREMNDTAFAAHCDSVADLGSQNTVRQLWNGEYFIQDVDLTKYPKYQYATGCLSDQLFGQTWAHLDHLGYIYPASKVKTALQSIWKYNWAPDVGPQNTLHKPERVYADPGEAGLLVCTWPKSRHPGEEGVRYRDEVWTGIEYQVATNMIYEGMTEEALSIIKGVHDRYSPEKHNPWNEIECGDHYARAMASWGVLLALEGFDYDGPAKSLGFAPKIQQDHFSGFFTGAEGWGTLEQERTGSRQTNSIHLRMGKLSLQKLCIDVQGSPRSMQLFLGKDKIPATYTSEEDKLLVKFDQLDIQQDQTLRLVIGLNTVN
jgi:uncharacterized protein (DUF608 family)